ncbi:YggS family pyridoxal phosphate enzyme, partial [Klebsiella pneumoniae]|nr:YggS family pyridoxal phosphate enzyme [Klebsiella pneumoniae]
GRDAPTLVAVSKRHDAGCVSAVTHAWRARGGRPLFGENYVQEALPKRAAVDAVLGAGATGWHCIGHLQRNKAREAAGAFDCVQTVDR